MLYTIISFFLLTAGILLFSLPVLRPACKRMAHAGSTAGKRPAPVNDMELPAPCGTVSLALGTAAIVYEPPVALVVKKDYPPSRTRFPADPFRKVIELPPRG